MYKNIERNRGEKTIDGMWDEGGLSHEYKICSGGKL